MSLLTPTTLSMAPLSGLSADPKSMVSCGAVKLPLSNNISPHSPARCGGPMTSGQVALSLPTDISANSTPSGAPVIGFGSASKAAISAVAALLLVTSPAMAEKVVEVGDEVGSFKFTPETIKVSAGESIRFTLVGETGHNIIFDVNSGTPPSVADELKKASMDENDLLSEDEPNFAVKLSTPGTYTYYCAPHKSANMKGTVIVE